MDLLCGIILFNTWTLLNNVCFLIDFSRLGWFLRFLFWLTLTSFIISGSIFCFLLFAFITLFYHFFLVALFSAGRCLSDNSSLLSVFGCLLLLLLFRVFTVTWFSLYINIFDLLLFLVWCDLRHGHIDQWNTIIFIRMSLMICDLSLNYLIFLLILLLFVFLLAYLILLMVTWTIWITLRIFNSFIFATDHLIRFRLLTSSLLGILFVMNCIIPNLLSFLFSIFAAIKTFLFLRLAIIFNSLLFICLLMFAFTAILFLILAFLFFISWLRTTWLDSRFFGCRGRLFVLGDKNLVLISNCVHVWILFVIAVFLRIRIVRIIWGTIYNRLFLIRWILYYFLQCITLIWNVRSCLGQVLTVTRTIAAFFGRVSLRGRGARGTAWFIFVRSDFLAAFLILNYPWLFSFFILLARRTFFRAALVLIFVIFELWSFNSFINYFNGFWSLFALLSLFVTLRIWIIITWKRYRYGVCDNLFHFLLFLCFFRSWWVFFVRIWWWLTMFNSHFFIFLFLIIFIMFFISYIFVIIGRSFRFLFTYIFLHHISSLVSRRAYRGICLIFILILFFRAWILILINNFVFFLWIMDLFIQKFLLPLFFPRFLTWIGLGCIIFPLFIRWIPTPLPWLLFLLFNFRFFLQTQRIWIFFGIRIFRNRY